MQNVYTIIAAAQVSWSQRTRWGLGRRRHCVAIQRAPQIDLHRTAQRMTVGYTSRKHLPGVNGATSKSDSSVTNGESLSKSARGWPMPPAAPTTPTLSFLSPNTKRPVARIGDVTVLARSPRPIVMQLLKMGRTVLSEGPKHNNSTVVGQEETFTDLKRYFVMCSAWSSHMQLEFGWMSAWPRRRQQWPGGKPRWVWNREPLLNASAEVARRHMDTAATKHRHTTL